MSFMNLKLARRPRSVSSPSHDSCAQRVHDMFMFLPLLPNCYTYQAVIPTPSSHALSRLFRALTAVFLHLMEHLGTSSQTAGIAAADADSAADVDGSDGAGGRMERTVPSEHQDRTSNQQQQTSSAPSGVLGSTMLLKETSAISCSPSVGSEQVNLHSLAM
ncbi:hypothetical protein AMECASPLE_027561 [Ameca splendens]|uniref:Uncharacterized protein n=1 Tax=Ameca splendens TaxID=208324 RepID=A0ABV0Y527_9TELE